MFPNIQPEELTKAHSAVEHCYTSYLYLLPFWAAALFSPVQRKPTLNSTSIANGLTKRWAKHPGIQVPHQAGHHPQCMDKKSRTDPLKAPKVLQTGTQPEDINLNAFAQLGRGSQHCFSHLFPTPCPSPPAVPGLQLQHIRASMEHKAAEPSTLQCQKAGILPFVL